MRGDCYVSIGVSRIIVSWMGGEGLAGIEAREQSALGMSVRVSSPVPILFELIPLLFCQTSADTTPYYFIDKSNKMCYNRFHRVRH